MPLPNRINISAMTADSYGAILKSTLINHMTNKPTWEEQFNDKFVSFEADGSSYGAGLKVKADPDELKDFISTKLAEKDEMWSKWKVLAETMDNAPVGHRVTIKHLLGEDEWTLTRRNKTN